MRWLTELVRIGWRPGALAGVRLGRRRRPGGVKVGFVLLEAVIALAIISMVAVGVLAVAAAQSRTAHQANVLLVASSLAEERLETLRLLDYHDLVALPDSLREGAFPPPLEDYAWTATVEPVEDEYDLLGVKVTVYSGEEAFPLRTLVFRERDPEPGVQRR